MAQQLGFFQEQRREIVSTAGGRIVYFPAVFSAAESQSLFEVLLQIVPWSSERMWMYEKLVDVPRLVASYEVGAEIPEPLAIIRSRAQDVVGVPFNGVSLNYYRDGTDSVAWHSDHSEDLTRNPTVALASFGATRSMLFRAKAPPRHQLHCDLEPGSVLAMCGDIQQHWEHHVPKVRTPTDARISVALRTKAA
ncbi:MAG: alpha-ketoglutarate-dependent dioxygenase AlkB [Candidatus Eremiobacteraeota bacterium]|nr:alpha-ketoglutarate-dependent dioxygenase AlkB [Candidatus Eremiobacteraeota bacterium]